MSVNPEIFDPPKDLAKDHRRAVAERNIEAILDAAERLLEGRTQATISAVAAEARISRVTVYAHFPTREQLLEAVAERAVQRTTAALDEAGLDEGSAADALDRVLAVGWRALGRYDAIAQATAEQLTWDARRRLHETAIARVEDLVERGRKQGDFRTDLPTEWLVASSFALIHAAGEEVRAGRLELAAAPQVLRATMRALLLRLSQ